MTWAFQDVGTGGVYLSVIPQVVAAATVACFEPIVDIGQHWSRSAQWAVMRPTCLPDKAWLPVGDIFGGVHRRLPLFSSRFFFFFFFSICQRLCFSCTCWVSNLAAWVLSARRRSPWPKSSQVPQSAPGAIAVIDLENWPAYSLLKDHLGIMQT